MSVVGCGTLPQAPSLSEPPIVYVWPVRQCPAQMGVQGYALGGALGSVALGEVSSVLFGIPSLFLAQAAKADQAGYTASSTNARYYFSKESDAETQGAADGTSTGPRLWPPRCYVIALYKDAHDTIPKASSWCNDKKFKEAVGKSCDTDGAAVLDNLNLVEPLPKGSAQGLTKTVNLRVPDFYAEVGFDELAQVQSATGPQKANGAAKDQQGNPGAQAQQGANSGQNGQQGNEKDAKGAAPESYVASLVIPKAVVMYYRNSLLTKDSRKSRALTITIASSQLTGYSDTAAASAAQGQAAGATKVETSAAAKAGLLNVNFAITLNAVQPGAKPQDADLAPYPPQVFLVPGLRDSVKLSQLPQDPHSLALDRVPVNVTATVHEIGDPSLFLAALVGATQSAGSDYSKAIVSAVLPPPGTQTLAQLVQKNNASVMGAVGSYWKDLASYQKECGNPSLPSQAAENAYLAPLWSQVEQDYSAANEIASSYGTQTGLPALPTQPSCKVKAK
jgi:hypothetical protein